MYVLFICMHTQKLRRIRVFDLSNAVEQIEEQQMKAMSLHTFKRILATESMCVCLAETTYMWMYIHIHVYNALFGFVVRIQNSES